MPRLCPHTVLRTQIRNVLRKCQRSRGNIVSSSLTQGCLIINRNCEVCLRTTMTRAPCRRRTGETVPLRAEKFGDLITADHKVLNEEGESRNNHRYAVVVTTSCYSDGSNLIRAKQNPHMRRKEVCQNSWNRRTDRKLYTQGTRWNLFGTACEDLSWNHRISAPRRSETTDIAERVVRRVKEGTSTVLLQSGLDEKMVVRFFRMLVLSSKSPRPPG